VALGEPSRLPQRAFVEQVGNRRRGNQTGRKGRVWHLRAGREIMGPVEGRATASGGPTSVNARSGHRSAAPSSFRRSTSRRPRGPTPTAVQLGCNQLTSNDGEMTMTAESRGRLCRPVTLAKEEKADRRGAVRQLHPGDIVGPTERHRFPQPSHSLRRGLAAHPASRS
jgi:hypothetical protein